MRYLLLVIILGITCPLYAQTISSSALLERSIAFHDPMNKWQELQTEFVLSMEIPNRPARKSKITINNEKGTFEVSYVSKGHLLSYQVDGLDSATVFSDFLDATGRTDIDSLDLTSDRARRWRNYYTYLYGLPMKLKDAGTNIGEEVREEYFNGEAVLSIKVTYDAEVGGDIWYFYFHPETYAMVGYRFYHDENINDGEYIVMDGMEIQNGMRIPKNRFWYTNEGARFLGADMMLSLKVN